MKSMLQLVRFPNLIIIALTQYMLQYAILLPELHRLNQQPVLTDFPFFLLVTYTLLVAAGGYIVNDIEDVEIDKLNKSERKRIVLRVFSIKTAWFSYWFCTLLGFIISLYLSFLIPEALPFYITMVALLYAYSRWFKRQPLIGNLAVALFCALVAWIVFYAQNLSPIFVIFLKTPFLHNTYTIFVSYTVFAFLSTLFREIVKDIEDAEGDRLENCRTLPLVIGMPKAKLVAGIVGSLLLFSLAYFSFILRGEGEWLKIILLNTTISLSLIYVLFLLSKASEKQDFTRLSSLTKGIMFQGLIFILVLKWL